MSRREKFLIIVGYCAYRVYPVKKLVTTSIIRNTGKNTLDLFLNFDSS